MKCDDCNKPQVDSRGCESQKPLKEFRIGGEGIDGGGAYVQVCDKCFSVRVRDKIKGEQAHRMYRYRNGMSKRHWSEM